MCFIVVGATVTLVTVFGVLMIILLPRSPTMELIGSEFVDITLSPFAMVAEDDWRIVNRNYYSVALTAYTYDLYYESVPIGRGQEMDQPPPFDARSESQVRALCFPARSHR